MKMLMAAALLASAGCAPAVFHSGRASFARREKLPEHSRSMPAVQPP